MRYRLNDDDIRRMLEHRFWIACREPEDGYIDRLAFDLDAKTPDSVSLRDDRYARLRDLFGPHRVPLVYHTPSGFGLRVVYRIPRVLREVLFENQSTGLLPDVLRAAGLAPSDGEVELYPQNQRPDRLPLGRRMPLLDPARLIPILHANIGDHFDQSLLEGALAEMEAWHSAPLTDLEAYLRTLPRSGPEQSLAKQAGTKQSDTRRPAASPETTELSTRDLLTVGLTRKGSRRKAEWAVGSAFVASPESFGEYGLSANPSARDIAHAVAVWLSRFNNGLSADWDRQVRAVGGPQEAVEVFTELYLQRDKRTGQSFVDRLYAKRAKQDPSYRRVIALSRAERDRVLVLGERHFKPDASRYRFECWMFAFLMSVKRIVYQYSRTGPVGQHVMDLSGVKRVSVQLPTKMLRRWPYGGGRGETGVIRYRQFFDILVAEGVLKLHKYYRTANLSRSGKGEASRYGIRPPNLNVLVRDVGIHPADLKGAIAGLKSYGGAPLTIYEAYHTLHVVDVVPNLSVRYGRATAARIKSYAEHIRDWLMQHPDVT